MNASVEWEQGGTRRAVRVVQQSPFRPRGPLPVGPVAPCVVRDNGERPAIGGGPPANGRERPRHVGAPHCKDFNGM